MDIAIKIISKIPDNGWRVICLILITLIFFLPLILIKKRSQILMSEILKTTKIALEIKKLMLEIDERVKPNKLEGSRSKELQSDYLNNDWKAPLNIDQDKHHIRYFDQIKFALSGSFFFLLIMGLTTLISTHELKSSNDFIAYFSKELGVSIASGFIATFVPWGNKWSYFIYGFLIPIQIALIIVLLT